MYFPPLEPVSISENYISGDVTVDPSAVVAPGAILQAAPRSKIVVGAGVCIGMGAIIKAYRGKIEIKRGSTIGAAVLVLGNSTIGAQCSVGAATTIFNTTVEPMTVIAPGSVIGDSSRQIQEREEEQQSLEYSPADSEPLDSKDTEQSAEEVRATRAESVPESLPLEKAPPPEPQIPIPEKTQSPSTSFEDSPWYGGSEMNAGTESQIEMGIEPEKEKEPPSSGSPVIGKVYINQLLLTLFPQKQ
jgi:carbon dioxide concentrating mechanism protein CcmN